jgi:hypothetical protein
MLHLVFLYSFIVPITITILDIIHPSVFYLKTRFGDWILSPKCRDFKYRTGLWVMSKIVIVKVY